MLLGRLHALFQNLTTICYLMMKSGLTVDCLTLKFCQKNTYLYTQKYAHKHAHKYTHNVWWTIQMFTTAKAIHSLDWIVEPRGRNLKWVLLLGPLFNFIIISIHAMCATLYVVMKRQVKVRALQMQFTYRWRVLVSSPTLTNE